MKKTLAIILLGLTLSLSACGKDVEKIAEESSSLLGGKEENKQSEQHDSFEYSTEPSLANLTIDLTTPEGVATAYYAWLNYGDGDKVCEILTNEYLQSLGGKEECVKNVRQYASSMRIVFPDNLDLAEVLKAVPNTKGSASTVTVILTLPTGAVYTEMIKLEFANNEWRVSGRIDGTSGPAI